MIQIAKTTILLVVASLHLLLPLTANGESGSDKSLATELARLRTEVESLASTIELEKEETRTSLRTLATQKAEIESDKRRSALRLSELKRLEAKMNEEDAMRLAREAQITPGVKGLFQPLSDEIKSGIPFRTAERIKSLENIEIQLNEGALTPGGALARVWAHVEDELRLAKESGLYKQVIEVDGKSILSDITRVGMMMLFFQTPNGTAGRAVKNGKDWTYLTWDSQTTDGQTEIVRVKSFQDAMLKQIRTGSFVLPAALDNSQFEVTK